MIFLNDRRIGFKQNSKHFKKHYKPLENKTWYCGHCDNQIKGSNDDLIYLGEYDVVAHLHDKTKGEFTPVYEALSGGLIKSHCVIWIEDIPQIQKLIKNTFMKSDNQTSQIKARDGFKCQLCGFDEDMALEVHHIVPKSSPFVPESFIRNPINCITLCANCHRITQSILRDGFDHEREKSVKEMGEINGWNMKWFDEMFYESHEVFKEYKDI